MHTFITVVIIILFCSSVLEAFYDMYRFSSECSDLSELDILLWAGFPIHSSAKNIPFLGALNVYV